MTSTINSLLSSLASFISVLSQCGQPNLPAPQPIGGAAISLTERTVELVHDTLPVIRLDTSEDEAATTIQKHFRGYLARKSHLPSDLYSQYYVQCEKAKGPQSHSIPRAEGRKTKVYLPQEMPGVVLKNSGRKNA